MNPVKANQTVNPNSQQVFSGGMARAPFFPFRDVLKDKVDDDPFGIEAAQNDFVNQAGMPSRPTEPGMTD